MSSQLQILAGTIVDDASVGTVAWSNPDNAKASDNVYAVMGSFITVVVYESTLKLVKGGTVQGSNLATGAALPTTEAYISYGSSSNLWGLSFTSADINASDFGVAYQLTYTSGNQAYSHYLKATNFGFSIPAGATINGILVEIEQVQGSAYPRDPSIDHIRITVYYTELSGPFPTYFHV